MLLSLILSMLVVFQQTTVPYKAASEFDIEIDLKLRSRNAPPAVGTEVPINDGKVPSTQYDGAPHSYVFLNLKLKKLAEKEIRCIVKDARGSVVYNKKVKEGALVKIEIGFIDDIKEKRANALYDVELVDQERAPQSHIRITIDSDGLYLVNGEKSGKF